MNINTSIENEYDVDDVVNFIITAKDNQFKNIALQFGNELQNEFQIEMYDLLSSKLSAYQDKQLFIIGDTSYGSCCCDDVTAMHINTDLIVRIGSSCFSKNISIPVYFLYKNIQPPSSSITEIISHIHNFMDQHTNTNILIFYNENYSKYLITPIKAHFNNNKQIHFADIEHYTNENKSKRRLYGRVVNDMEVTSDVNLMYIGKSGDCLLSELVLRFSQVVKEFVFVNVIDFSMEKVSNGMCNSVLYRRFNLIAKAKESNVFGILIGALALYDVNEVIEEVKRTLEMNKKKWYVFLLGKITEEKLANFVMFIDCFVLIACPFNAGYFNKALMKPIVSPLDIKMAFDPNYKWDSIYSFDTQFILDKEKQQRTQNESKETIIDNQNDNNSSIQVKSKNEELIPVFSAFTLEKYDQLKFKGLEINSDNNNNNDNSQTNTVSTIKKGKRGIPIKYENL